MPREIAGVPATPTPNGVWPTQNQTATPTPTEPRRGPTRAAPVGVTLIRPIVFDDKPAEPRETGR